MIVFKILSFFLFKSFFQNDNHNRQFSKKVFNKNSGDVLFFQLVQLIKIAFWTFECLCLIWLFPLKCQWYFITQFTFGYLNIYLILEVMVLKIIAQVSLWEYFLKILIMFQFTFIHLLFYLLFINGFQVNSFSFFQLFNEFYDFKRFFKLILSGQNKRFNYLFILLIKCQQFMDIIALLQFLVRTTLQNRIIDILLNIFLCCLYICMVAKV
ncbi:Hypothetical_protein [Hexamita inflata]|uniref:Hypothetical_protein n=1 Tax=Hexamita inflata TaxID=28002 RepID=A0AA86UW29_9EUKA|nr:Hypothetical protein HINF_LOCUS38703 [Hexamita inflata]